MLRLVINERLTAAAEEIFGLVEKTIAEYQDEIIRSQREVAELKLMIKQLTVLNPEVSLFRFSTDLQSVPEKASLLQQQDQLPNEEENETHDSQAIKKEKVDLCIAPELEAYSSDNVDVRLDESEKTTRTNCQLSPTFRSITLTLGSNKEWNGTGGSGSPSCGLSHGGTSFVEQKRRIKRQFSEKNKKHCRFCHMQFETYSALIRHVDKIHSGRKAFKCSECDKEFPRREHMKLHMRTHTNEKPYRCNFCEKLFTQSSNLNVHLRIHTGEKPYFCSMCCNMVASTYHLKKCGTKASTVGNSLRCLDCGKMFYSAVKLRVHMNIHKARKPYTIASAAYNTSDSLA
ncbi:zinc finger protein 501-like [Channa argus]|uniref:zinc finger protein 501-like n=1 Tax=Channa argus TaxID=215402 RepID=UPI0029446FAB|nr:hypothetical protein Q8A73_001111 [Channa argus]